MWTLFFTPEAERDFSKTDKALRQRISGRLNWLTDNFDDVTPLPLGGEWHGYFKLRIGDFRVIYKIIWEKNVLIIYAIGPRDKIYKRAPG